MEKYHKLLKWTDDEIRKDALKYSYRTEWARESNKAYKYASKRGIKEQCCLHMLQVDKWTIEKLIESAKQYKFRSEWDKNDKNAYEAARIKNVLDICCAHMERKQNPYTDKLGVIYSFIFDDNFVYIGLSISPERRYRDHLLRGPVFKKIKEGIDVKYEILERDISIEMLSYKEIDYMEQFKSKGFNLINKRKGGCLGIMENKISNKSIVESALKYKFRGDWCQSIEGRRYYDAARRRKILEEVCKHMSPKSRGPNKRNKI